MAERVPPPPPPTAPPETNPEPPAAEIEAQPQAQAQAQPQNQPLPARGSGTYVVQVPKDQIYRVPPPENARIAERYRKPEARRRRCCCGCASWCLAALLVAAILVLAAAAAFYFLLRPSARFSVERIRFAGAGRRGGAPRYTVDVGVRNPSDVTGVSSPGGGSAVLYHEGSCLAAGKVPSFDRGPGRSRTITVSLSGDKGKKLPAETKKQKDGGVTFSLAMEFPVKLKVLSLGTSTSVAHVSCSIRVSTLAEGTPKVLHQICQFRQ